MQYERQTAAAKARPVLGVFVGWRGLSEYGLGDAIADATFWGRQAAAQRVATGSPRELFGRLPAGDLAAFARSLPRSSFRRPEDAGSLSSEDLQHGRRFGDRVLVVPFLSAH